MTEPSSDNFYLLLELDASQDIWDHIQARIQEKKREWSSQAIMGNPESRRLAQQCLKLLPEMERALANPQTRATIAGEARRLCETQRTGTLAEMDQFIRLLTQPTLTSAEFRVRFQRFIHALSEPEVREHIKRAGIHIEDDPGEEAVTGAEAFGPALDPSVRARIRGQLAQLKLNSLYEFLNLPASATPDLLRQHAKQIHREMLNRGVIDRESGLRKELAGECMSVFRDAARKSAYDQTLVLDELSALDRLIDFTADDGVIEYAEFDKVLRLARDSGIDEDAAHDYIKHRAAANRWPILHRRSDIRHVKRLLALGNRAASRGDDATAEQHFEACLKSWPAWAPATEAKRQLELKRQAKEDQRLQAAAAAKPPVETMAKAHDTAHQKTAAQVTEAKKAWAKRRATLRRRVVTGVFGVFLAIAAALAVATRNPSQIPALIQQNGWPMLALELVLIAGLVVLLYAWKKYRGRKTALLVLKSIGVWGLVFLVLGSITVGGLTRALQLLPNLSGVISASKPPSGADDTEEREEKELAAADMRERITRLLPNLSSVTPDSNPTSDAEETEEQVDEEELAAADIRERIARLSALRYPPGPELSAAVTELRGDINQLTSSTTRNALRRQTDDMLLAALEREGARLYESAATAYAAGEFEKAVRACRDVRELRLRPDVSNLAGGSVELITLVRQADALEKLAKWMDPRERFKVTGFMEIGGHHIATLYDNVTSTKLRVKEGDTIFTGETDSAFEVEELDPQKGVVVLVQGIRSYSLTR